MAKRSSGGPNLHFARCASLLCALGVQAAAQSAPAGAAAPQPGTAGADATHAQLRLLIDHGHTTQALQQLDREAQGTPEPAGVEHLRGLALYAGGNLPAADQAFAKALAENAADNESRQMRGIVLFRLGRPAAAIPLLEAGRAAAGATTAGDAGAAEATQTPVDPAYVLALCYLDTRRYDDARAAFAAQFGFAPGSASAYLLAARMLLRREYLPIAQQFAHKALELSPAMPRAHLLLGETELAGNHLDLALAEFLEERKLNPLEPTTYDRLGDTYVRQGAYDQARLALQEAILLEPNSTGPFILLGKVLLKQDNATGAAGYLEHARTMDADNYMTHSLLGQAYRRMGRADDARRETDTAQRLQAASEPKIATQP